MKNIIIICTEKLQYLAKHSVSKFLYEDEYKNGFQIKENILNIIKENYNKNLGSNEKSLWITEKDDSFEFKDIDETQFYQNLDKLRKSCKLISYGKLGSINLVIIQELSTETQNMELTSSLFDLLKLNNDTFVTRVNNYREIIDCILPDLIINNKYIHANDVNKMTIGEYDFKLIPNEFLLIPEQNKKEWTQEINNNFKLYSADGKEITDKIIINKGINNFYLICDNSYTLRNSNLTGSYKIGNGIITILGV